jgi:precorrin-2 dehydrogenase/sirohydrochlorin ferrochelatase
MMPLVLNLRGRKVVIYGAGAVALRKARLFSRACEVTVVSASFRPEFDDLPVRRIERTLPGTNDDVLEGALLAIPATDDGSVNDALAREAQARGVWVNRVDAVGDVLVPSLIRRGDVVVAISTLGQSPALAKYLRRKIEGLVGEDVAWMARLQAHLRERLQDTVGSQEDRERVVWEVLEDEDVWRALREGDWGRALEATEAVVRRHLDAA